MTRLGLIGCGSMANSHLKARKELEGRASFVGFADIEVAKARAAAAETEGAVVSKDYTEILPHVDAVIISLPHDLHHSIGLACLRSGTHVLMEKPLALTETECSEMVAADTSPDPVLMIGYVMRHDPLWSEMGRYIRKRTFGDVFHVSIWTEQYTDSDRAPWLGQANRLGGGQLFSHGCHYIDLLLHWMGDPETGSHIGTNFGTPWMEREGTSNVSIKFGSGATAYHFGTWGAKGSKHGYSVHAHCAEGMLELNHAEGTITLHRDESGGDLPDLASLAVTPDEPESTSEVVVYRRDGVGGKVVGAQLSAFLDCIENHQKPEISAAASIRSLRVIWRLYDAEDRGIVADLRGL